MMEKHETVVRVLVADDDEVFLEILAETVEQADAAVELAPDGLAALEQLSAGDFDLLISDLNMPRMDGLTLLRQVRTFYPHILCILITGFGSLESAIQALRLGAYDYIQKPFMMEQVGVTIRNAVDRVKAFKERAGLLLEIEKLQRKVCSLRAESLAATVTTTAASFRGTLFGPIRRGPQDPMPSSKNRWETLTGPLPHSKPSKG